MEGSEGKKKLDWREIVTQDLDYYIDTEEGRRKLAEMVKAESQLLLEQLGKSRQRIKDVIWLSKWCRRCGHFEQIRSNYMRCRKLDARIVKPFYGRPLWAIAISADGEKELVVEDVDWDAKSFDINDRLIEVVIENINGGLPYSCFAIKEELRENEEGKARAVYSRR